MEVENIHTAAPIVIIQFFQRPMQVLATPQVIWLVANDNVVSVTFCQGSRSRFSCADNTFQGSGCAIFVPDMVADGRGSYNACTPILIGFGDGVG